MARVPSFTSDQVSDLQAPRIPYQSEETPRIYEAGKLAVARGVGDVAQGVEHVAVEALRVKAEFDRNEVESRLNDLASKQTEIDSHVVTLKERAALGSADASLAQYNDAATKLAGTLANDQQRELFKRQVDQHRQIAFRGWKLHEAQQLELQGEKDDAAATDRNAALAGSTWKVGKLPDGRRPVDVLLDSEMKRLADRAVLKGWSDNELLERQRHSRAKIVGSFVLEAIANPQDYGADVAREVLLKYAGAGEGKPEVNEKGEIVLGPSALMDAQVIHQLWDAVRAAGVRDEVRSEFQRIIAGSKIDPATRLPDLSAQVNEARKIKNPEIAEQVIGQLRQQWAIDDEMLSHRGAQLAARMTDALDDAYQHGKALSINEASPEWLQMRDVERTHVRTHLTSLLNATKAQRQAELQQAQWLLMSLPPSERANADVDALFPGLDKARRNALKATVVKAQQDVARDSGLDANRVHALVQDAAPEKWSKLKKGRFQAHIDAELAKKFPDKSKPPDLTAVQEAIAAHLLYGDTGWGLFSPNRTWWEAEEEGATEGWKPFAPKEQIYEPNKTRGLEPPPPRPTLPGRVKPIPEAMKKRIDEQLRSEGVAPEDMERRRMNAWVNMPGSRED